MSRRPSYKVGRRAFIGGSAAAIAGLAAAPALAMEGSTEADDTLGGPVRSNVSSFRMLDWQDYFANTRQGAILCRYDVARAALLVRGSVGLPALSDVGARCPTI